MGLCSQSGVICGLAPDQSEIKVYGDYFNADTRTILNILMISGVQPRLVEVDSLLTADSEARSSFRRQENPADCLPMLVHNNYKIMSNMEYILKYLENTYP